jgi:thiamine-phosphate pyrophosphorylase
MPDGQAAKLYLLTPSSPALAEFPDVLAGMLDQFDIACVRLGLAGGAEDDFAHAADALRGVCHERDVPLVVAEHFRLVERLGIDGVHLSGGARQVREARKALGAEAIVGAWTHASRHDGMSAGEAGADYVSFGPLTPSSLGDGVLAPVDLFKWWSEMIEIPVVAEGGLTLDIAGELAGVTDFIALGDELWSHSGGPTAALREFLQRLE